MVKISKTYVPKEKEKYMCAKHLAFFKKKLIDWKNDLNNWQIEITINKNTHIDPKRYDDNVLDKVMEYYNYYYNKYKSNTNQNR